MRYLAFFKPDEVLTQFTDAEGRVTLKDYIPVQGVYAAGRLDYHSEGLLLLTNDGSLIHRLTSPEFAHDKTYLAQVEGLVTDEAIQTLRTRQVLSEGQTSLPSEVSRIPVPDLPARPRPVRAYHPTSWLRIVIREGKKHQVRRMTAAVGFPTLRLVRIAIGSLKLGELQPGEWRDLTPEEVRSLKEQAGLHQTGPNQTRMPKLQKPKGLKR